MSSSRAQQQGAARGSAVFLALSLCAGLAAFVWLVRVASYSPLPMAEIKELAASQGEFTPGADSQVEGVGFPWHGGIHVHSRLSDGAGDVDEIAAAASTAGLDFIILSDHNPIGGGGRPASGWYGDVLVLVGEELSTNEGHLLALGVPEHRYRLGPTAREAVDDVEAVGGQALVAHPGHRDEPWTGGWTRVAGLEVVSLSEAWSRATPMTKLATGLAYPIDTDYAMLSLLANRSPALARLDELTALTEQRDRWPRPRLLVGSVDAHGAVRAAALPGYEGPFRALQTVVWADRPADPGDQGAEAAVLSALLAGRAAAVVGSVGPPEDFVFAARSPGRPGWVPMGRLESWEQGPWEIVAGMAGPGPYRIVLLRDGIEVAASTARPLTHRATGPGTYRIEVFRIGGGPGGAGRVGATPWIASNPIYLWPAAYRTAARLRPAPPLPAPPVSASLMALPHWGTELGGGVEGTMRNRDGVRVWSFELPEEPLPDSYAAAAWRPREPVDWRDSKGLVVSLTAAEPLRLWLEVRALTAAGEVVTWRRSVKAGPGRGPFALPWSGWPQGPGPAELGRVAGTFLIVTSGLLAPGTAIEVRIEELGLYGGRAPGAASERPGAAR